MKMKMKMKMKKERQREKKRSTDTPPQGISSVQGFTLAEMKSPDEPHPIVDHDGYEFLEDHHELGKNGKEMLLKSSDLSPFPDYSYGGVESDELNRSKEIYRKEVNKMKKRRSEGESYEAVKNNELVKKKEMKKEKKRKKYEEEDGALPFDHRDLWLHQNNEDETMPKIVSPKKEEIVVKNGTSAQKYAEKDSILCNNNENQSKDEIEEDDMVINIVQPIKKNGTLVSNHENRSSVEIEAEEDDMVINIVQPIKKKEIQLINKIEEVDTVINSMQTIKKQKFSKNSACRVEDFDQHLNIYSQCEEDLQNSTSITQQSREGKKVKKEQREKEEIKPQVVQKLEKEKSEKQEKKEKNQKKEKKEKKEKEEIKPQFAEKLEKTKKEKDNVKSQCTQELENVLTKGNDFLDSSKDSLSRPTISIAVAGSIVDNAQSLELATILAGQIARAAAIFRIDEIVVFDDYDGVNVQATEQNGNLEGGHFMAQILEYLEVPQYLRRALIPMHRSLSSVGKLPPLDAPHHLRKHERRPFREGVVLDKVPSPGSGSYVDVGLDKEVQVAQSLKSGTRVTVSMGKSMNTGDVLQVVDHETVRQAGHYWGYRVRYASCLSAVFDECPFANKYDYCIGTSEHGKQIRSSELTIPKCRHLLIAFGGLSGLEESLELDKKLQARSITSLFDLYLNTCPNQGSRTIRTEEAILISLQFLQEAIEDAIQMP